LLTARAPPGQLLAFAASLGAKARAESGLSAKEKKELLKKQQKVRDPE
jgi:hypothetical protein